VAAENRQQSESTVARFVTSNAEQLARIERMIPDNRVLLHRSDGVKSLDEIDLERRGAEMENIARLYGPFAQECPRY